MSNWIRIKNNLVDLDGVTAILMEISDIDKLFYINFENNGNICFLSCRYETENAALSDFDKVMSKLNV